MQDNNQNKNKFFNQPKNELNNITQPQEKTQKKSNDIANNLEANKFSNNASNINLPQESTNNIADINGQLPHGNQRKINNQQEWNNHQPRFYNQEDELANKKRNLDDLKKENQDNAENYRGNDSSITSNINDDKFPSSLVKVPNPNNKKVADNNLSSKSTSKNPSRNNFNNIAKKNSKHAKNESDKEDKKDDYAKKSKQSNLSSKSVLKDKILNKTKSNFDNQKEQQDEESEEQQSTGEQLIGKLGKIIRQKIILLAASNIGIFVIVFLIAIIAVVLISSNNGGFASEDGKTLCYVATKCQTVVIKNEDEEKSYNIDEFISGAIVNYYKKDLFLNDLLGNNDNIYKALEVIIHSDLVYYSNTNEDAGTCTITDNNKFKEIYIPTEDSTSDDATNEETSENNSNYDSENITEEQIEGAIKEETRLKKYYEKAKSNINSVRNMMTIGYSNGFNLYYVGYEQYLYGTNAKSNYEDIIKDYLPLNDNLKEEDKQIVYPICNFEGTNDNAGNDNSNSGTIVVDDLCSQVVVTDNMVDKVAGHTVDYSGVYSYNQFIEGVVANETGYGWNKYPDILKAHAVAARTYFYNTVKGSSKYGSIEGNTCYFTTSTYSMGFKKNNDQAITQAVNDTAGEYIMVDGKISKEARWDAFTYSSVDDTYYIIKQRGLRVPKTWIESKISKGTIDYNHQHSHGAGMSQWGAAYMVMEQGKNYKDVISYFYGADIAKVTTGYVMPINTFTSINGEKSVGYCGSKEPHNGLDFGAPSGTPVYAATSGVIEKEYSYVYQCYQKPGTTNVHYKDCTKGTPNYGDNMAGQGFKIKNDDGTYSLYFHFSKKENLHKGDRVSVGQKIGEVGTTGYSTGPHLHYEMRLTSVGNVVEPRNYLPMEGYSICYNYPGYK